MDNDLQIGEKIRKQRIKANLTQEKLAEYSDLSINFISKWSTDKREPYHDKIMARLSLFTQRWLHCQTRLFTLSIG